MLSGVTQVLVSTEVAGEEPPARRHQRQRQQQQQQHQQTGIDGECLLSGLIAPHLEDLTVAVNERGRGGMCCWQPASRRAHARVGAHATEEEEEDACKKRGFKKGGREKEGEGESNANSAVQASNHKMYCSSEVSVEHRREGGGGWGGGRPPTPVHLRGRTIPTESWVWTPCRR